MRKQPKKPATFRLYHADLVLLARLVERKSRMETRRVSQAEIIHDALRWLNDAASAEDARRIQAQLAKGKP